VLHVTEACKEIGNIVLAELGAKSCQNTMCVLQCFMASVTAVTVTSMLLLLYSVNWC